MFEKLSNVFEFLLTDFSGSTVFHKFNKIYNYVVNGKEMYTPAEKNPEYIPKLNPAKKILIVISLIVSVYFIYLIFK